MVPPASLSPKLVKTAIWGHVAFFIGTLNLGRVECNGIKKLWSTSGTPTIGRADVSVDPTVVSADVSERPLPTEPIS